MDILNWIYLKKQQLIKKKANNAESDLVVLGAQVPFTKRDDGYQSYGMTLEDATFSGGVANNTYKTGVYADYPFYITPSMVPTYTTVQQVENGMFPMEEKLVGYKIGGSYDLSSAEDTYIIKYIGTIETTDNSYLYLYPFKVSGSVACYPNWPGPTPIISNFANGASVHDDNGDLVPAELMNISIDQYDFNAADLFLVISSSTAVNMINGDVTFEFEFQAIDGQQLKFTLY